MMNVTAPAQRFLVLSLFPGIDLLGKGFELEGFCVVRGPDIIWGGDIRGFHPISGHFDGVIGGSPCQDFSRVRRAPPTGYGDAMLKEYIRSVTQADPAWFLLENVPGVPDIQIHGYKIQRFNLNARECGVRQNRLRSFQFGSKTGQPLVIRRSVPMTGPSHCCLATEGKRQDRRGFPDFCELMGLPRSFDLPGLTRYMKYKVVGNGVPIPMARVCAAAIKAWRVTDQKTSVCACGCGRETPPTQTTATASCRKRMQRKRDKSREANHGPVTKERGPKV